MFNSQCHSHLLDSANTMDLFFPIWTPLLIPLGMKWIQWLWLDQFFLPFCLSIILLSFLTIPCFYQYTLFIFFSSLLEVWHCTFFYIYCILLSSNCLWRIKEYNTSTKNYTITREPPTTAFLSSSFFITS